MPYIYKRVHTPHRDFITRTKCYYYNTSDTKKSRGVRMCKTSDGKKKRNQRAAYLRRKYLIFNNFDKGDIWATLTWRADKLPETFEQAHKLLMNVIGKLRRKLKKNGIELTYFVKTEAGENSRVHHHLFIKNNFAVISMLYEYWKEYGNVKDFKEVYDMQSGRLVKYILDGGDHKELNFEKYSHSRNLKEPEIETRIYPAESFRENPKPPKTSDGTVWIIENLNNFFPDRDGFIYQEYELVKKELDKT